MKDSTGKRYLHSDLTRKIIGCAMDVHSTLGNGFQEVIYQRCLEIEFQSRGIQYAREYMMDIRYKGQLVGKRCADFFVEDAVMVELKAVKELEDMHLAQAINYLEVSGQSIGLLINFGSRKLDFRRVMLPYHKQN